MPALTTARRLILDRLVPLPGIQPGRPFACAFAGLTCILSLPGNPVAAPRADRLTLLRVVLDHGPDGLRAASAGRQATGFLRTLSDADALAFVPAGPDLLPAGTLVDIHYLRHETAMGEGRR